MTFWISFFSKLLLFLLLLGSLGHFARATAAPDDSVPEEKGAPLAVRLLEPGKPSPQMAGSTQIAWRATASGGVGEHTFAFEVKKNGAFTGSFSTGSATEHPWTPLAAGEYQWRVAATDALGQVAWSPWSAPYEITPPLTADRPEADRTERELVAGEEISWSVSAAGGVGPRSYVFELEKDGSAQPPGVSSPLPDWTWTPTESGHYRVRVQVTDRLGNTVHSPWSTTKRIVSPLTLVGLRGSGSGPLLALKEEIRWTAEATGGAGKLEYTFFSLKNDIPIIEQRGESSEWVWRPARPGTYKLRVVAADEAGNVADSGWSEEQAVQPGVHQQSLLAVLPVENLSTANIPSAMMQKALTDAIASHGMPVLPGNRLEELMKKHRMRYVGGVDLPMARAFREEAGAEAVVITSVESFQDGPTPKVSLISRLVSCGRLPRIVWMDSVGLTSEDQVGLLDLGRVTESDQLINQAVSRLAASLAAFLAGEQASLRLAVGNDELPAAMQPPPSAAPKISAERKYRPQVHFRSPDFANGRTYSVALVPFFNRYARRHAGSLLPLHLAEHLLRFDNFEIIEPGLVRETLLKYRLIMQEGPSLAISDVLASPGALGGDLILSGEVFDYQDQFGTPKVDFSVQFIDGESRKVIWWSRSRATGQDGVVFFNMGTVHSAHELAQQLSAGIVGKIVEQQKK